MGKFKQFLKKTTAVLTIAVLLIGIAPIGSLADVEWSEFALTASAEELVDGDYKYTVENGEATITSYIGDGGDIVIPSKLGGYSVVSIGSSAYLGRDNLNTVQIPHSVTKIENYAFYDSSLTCVKIGNGVTHIGDHAFNYCVKLESVEFPSNVIYIGKSAFENCHNLSNVYYGGDGCAWDLISIGDKNECLTEAYIYFNSDIHIHEYFSTIITQPTCSTVGAKTYSCSCGDSYVEPIQVTLIVNSDLTINEPRYYDDVYVAKGATLTITSEVNVIGNLYVFGTVINSGKVVVGDTLYCLHYNSMFSAGNYDYGYYKSTGSTEAYSMNITDDYLLQTTMPNIAHSYTPTITTPATCTETGITTYTCECGDSYTKTISATGKHTGGTATCKAKAICTVCKQPYGELAKHKEVTVAGTPATYTTEGKTEGKKCSVCNTVTVKQTTIPKLSIKGVKVTGLKAKKVKVAKASEITLSWTSLGEGVKYEVYQKNGKKWKKLKTTSSTSYTVKKLKADKEYQFRVRAVVDGVNGSYSKTLKVETIPETTTLKLKAGKKQLTASWSTVSGISGYEVQYSTSKKMKSAKTVNVKKSSKKTTIKKLSKGKKYYVRVRAYKTVDGKKVYSGWSKVKNVKVK